MQRATSTCRRVGLRVCTEFPLCPRSYCRVAASWPHMALSAHSGMADALGVSFRAPILNRDRATVDQAKFTNRSTNAVVLGIFAAALLNRKPTVGSCSPVALAL